ncbi:hypothetical protein BCR43DRAFT_481804 [Syncephalastrum racemosum]|uniref:Alpha and gamma adaptin binding protein p34-domain-containing protein n=1 Tax=Syncephalastrum racemosum TaxID=13706 RepID=A0A1X2HSP0_SYNRA|nr:hypothetical protein BCR43DRAFT_481804 [Syncephalastrum racemosum]
MSDGLLRNKILVVGQTGQDLVEFVKGVFKTNNEVFPESLVNEELKAAENQVSGIRIPWTIKNKYYTAKVDYWLDQVTPSQTDVIAGYADPNNSVGRVVDAFVYVFRKDQPETFEGVKAWTTFIENCSPSIQLCVSFGAGPDMEDSVEGWCVEHQFEYVDLEAKQQEELNKAGWGLALDALQANMWDGMSQNAQHQDTIEQGNASDLDIELDSDLLKELGKLRMENSAEDDGEGDDLTGMPTKEEIEKMHAQLFGGIDDEDGLDKTLETMQALREQGKNLPDAERRKLAAQVALSFSAQLGL